MKLWSRISVGIFAGLLLCISSSSYCSAKGGYTTDEYNVDINVNTNQSYNIQESIKVYFNEERHGIYRYIPHKGTMYRNIDGKDVETDYKATIEDVAINEDYEESFENDFTTFKIGDADNTIKGSRDYSIGYTYQMYNDDEENGYDEFYLNVIPTGWESKIDSAAVTIQMPKEFDSSKLEVYSGEYGAKDSGKTAFQVDGKTITIQAVDLKKGEGVTVYTKLPEDYFVGVPDDIALKIASIVVAIVGIIGLMALWFVYGRNRKYVKTIEFYPPEDMTPAQIGYVVDGTVDKKDLISLIMYHAQKGYLTIEEEKKSFGKSDIILHKCKPGIPNSAHNYEKKFYKGLFKGRESVYLDNLGDDFYKAYEKAEEMLKDSFIDKDTGKDRIFEDMSKKARVGAFILGLLLYGTGCIMSGLIAGDYGASFMHVFDLPFIGFLMYVLYRIEKAKVAGTLGRKIWLKILAVVAGVAAVFSTLIIFFGTTNTPGIFIIYPIFSLVWCYTVAFMGRRTEEGARLQGQLLGFKDFLAKAEKDKLEKLVDENPAYFYNVLPYAYVLGVSDKWAKNFEQMNVEPPYWYQSDNMNSFTTAVFISHMNHCNHEMSSGIASVTPSSSGGSSGGGFSGGGSGGGGGGSW